MSRRIVDAAGLAYFYKCLKNVFVTKAEFDKVKIAPNCPHCGAPFGKTDICEYCGSYIGEIKFIYKLEDEKEIKNV